MKTKEQLLKEHAEWTVKYMQAHEHIGELLSTIRELPEQESMEKLISIWTQLEWAQTNLDMAWVEMLEIQEKLSQ